jgi:diaminohydroxyphosphoribosylaminopyrimidine deaminase/5-amino-6-(5-phosphoribosylamino)uracil reductase
MSVFSVEDHQYMARAIKLARKGLYSTHPNPRVGCVLVKNGAIIGEGYHQKAGEAHAEVLALQEAGPEAKGATAYVTLEPCSHHGKTPPCADALVAAEVSRVIVAARDPNPLVGGKGLDRLSQAGIQVQSGLMDAEAIDLNPGFHKRMTQGLPWVRIKMAMSLDGRTAMASGESQWITGEEARRDVQFLRARSEAILTGIGTVKADNPALNVRLSSDDLDIQQEVIQPLRVIVDSRLDTPSNSKLLGLPGKTLVFYSQQDTERESVLKVAGAEPVHCQGADERVDLEAMLRELANREVNEIHVEAGEQLCGTLLEAGLVDEIIIYMAGHIIGSSGKGLFNLESVSSMSERKAVKIQDIRSVGADWRIQAMPEDSGEQ